MSNVYNNIVTLLNEHGVNYEEFDHEPILNYEDADREAKRLGWTGVESKNVFIKGKNGNYYLYVTTMGNNVDFKAMKKLLGTKCGIASGDDVRDVIECVPGCVSPFGFSANIKVIVDNSVFDNDYYLFSPGVTTKTIQCKIIDLKPVFENLKNEVVFV